MFKDQPCWNEANKLLDVPRWGMVDYHGSFSKQSSRCSSLVRDSFCWALMDYTIPDTSPPSVVTGWMPVGRVVNTPNVFADAFCNGNPGDVTEAFVRELCDRCAGKPPCPDPPTCRIRGVCNPVTGLCSAPSYSPLGTPCGIGSQCNGQGGCIAGLNVPSDGTLVEPDDAMLPNSDLEWLQQLDSMYQASTADPSKQMDLLYEAEAVRFKACGWYNEDSFR